MSNSKLIELGGKWYTLGPVPAIGLEVIGDRLELIGNGTASRESIGALVDALYYGIKRNHMQDPEVTREMVQWGLDATNMATLMQAFAEVNAVPSGNPGGGEGEAPAGR